MKKILKIVFALLVSLIAALFAIPYFYKDKIVAYVKEDINKNLNAKVDFKDVDLSLFKSFPDFNLRLKELTVDGVDTFKNVRLLEVKNMDFVLDIKSVLKGEQMLINKIAVNDAKVNIKVNADGTANYNITKPTKESNPSKFDINLKKYSVENSNITYDDQSMGFKALLIGLNHEGSGKLSDKIYELKTHSTVDSLTISYANINYLNKVNTSIDTDFDISGDFSKFTLKNTKATVNELPLTADGFVEMKEKEIVMDINYKTQDANIAQLLSLVPKEYMPDLKGVKTSGVAQLTGYVKGHSTDTDLPGFKLLVDVKNASIQYPDLPEKVSNINLLTDVDFKGGSDLNTMIVDLPRIDFDIAGSHVKGKLNVKQPMTDPFIAAAFSSKLDFAKVKNAVKFEQIKDLSGLLDADISLNASMSAMTNQVVEKIDAKGYFNLTNFSMKSDAYKDPIKISTAKVDVTPAQLLVKELNTQIGNNDLQMNGFVSNYLPYFLKDNAMLKGQFDFKSKNLNLNDFMTSDSAPKTAETPKTTTPTGIIKVPNNLDIALNMVAEKVKFQKMDLTNVTGKLLVANQEVKLTDVNMNVLGGTITMGGLYNTAGEKAKTNFKLGLKQMGIKESATSFDMLSSYAPILNNITGKFLSDLDLNVDLDNNMSPILTSVNAKGLFKTDEISVNGINILKKVGDLLKLNELHNPKIDKLNASFSIQNGTLTLNPNSFKLNGYQAAIEGTFNLDKQLNMVLSLDIPREKLGGNINSVINNIAGVANKLDLTKDIGQVVKTKFKITGNITNPQIKPILMGNGGQTLTQTVTEVVQTKVEAVKNDALAKAQAEADKLINIAKVQKQKLVEEAEKLALETKEKAKLAADEVLKQAGDNPLKKVAAKAAADKIIKEGDKKAVQIVDTANKKGDDLVQKAQTQADELINKAKETGK